MTWAPSSAMDPEQRGWDTSRTGNPDFNSRRVTLAGRFMWQDAPTVARGEGKCTDSPALVTDARAAGAEIPFRRKPLARCARAPTPPDPRQLCPPTRTVMRKGLVVLAMPPAET